MSKLLGQHGNLEIGNAEITGTLAVTGATTITGALTQTGALSIDDTTTSSSATTGSLHTDGGVGIAGTLYVGGAATLAAAVTLTGAIAMTGTSAIAIGTTGTPLVLTAGTPIFNLYSTCASTSGSTSAQPFYVKSTMTGIGGVGARAQFHMYTNVALGGWANALKAYAEYGTSGRITGLASALCAEMLLPNANLGSGGAYFPLEIEHVSGGTSLVTAGSLTGNHTGFIYMAASGDADGDFDDNGFLFHITGLTSGSGHLFYANKSVPFDAYLKIGIDGATYYLGLLAQQAAAS